MASESPPFDDGGYYDDGYTYHRRGVSLLGMLAILLFSVLSIYLTLLVVTRLDHIVLPGNELGLGGLSVVGLDSAPGSDHVATPEERINVLFLGIDRRVDEAEDQPYRTDSIMVLTIDPFTKTSGAFSIPRDVVVEIPDGDGGVYTKTRINEAYEYGEYLMPGGYPGGGAQLAKDTIELNFDIPIDHYVLMDWVDFIDIVDELGGVDVTVPEYAYDPAYTTCTFCGDIYPVEFIPGTEHMDGERALAYARIRKSDNDFKRIERQQIVLRAIATKASNVEEILSNPVGIFNQFRDAIETDISDGRAPGLALLAKQAGVNSLVTVSMASATYTCEWCPFAGLEFNREKMEELKALVFSDSRITGDNATVEILNGTPTPALADAFASYMRSQGIASDRISTDEYADGLLYDTTIVIDRNGGHEYTVEKVAEWLGLPEAQIVMATDPQAEPFLDTLSDIIIVLGSDIEVDYNGTLTVTTPEPLE